MENRQPTSLATSTHPPGNRLIIKPFASISPIAEYTASLLPASRTDRPNKATEARFRPVSEPQFLPNRCLYSTQPNIYIHLNK